MSLLFDYLQYNKICKQAKPKKRTKDQGSGSSIGWEAVLKKLKLADESTNLQTVISLVFLYSPYPDNMKKNCNSAANIAEEVPDILPITIKISAGGLAFNYPEKFKSDLPSLLKCLDPQIAAELPSQIFPKPDGPINIKEMTIAPSRFVKITVVVNGPFEFLGGQISIADLELTVEWTKGEDLKFSAVTTITVGKLAVGLTLEKQGDSYMFAAYVESFKLNELEEMIGSTNLLDFLSLLGSLEGFGIKDFKLVKTFGSGSDSSLR